MMIGLRSLGYAAGALETVADSQGAAYGIYEIIEAVRQLHENCCFQCKTVLFLAFQSDNGLRNFTPRQ
jgi:hypothetical protein